jgi:stearoyl-CoA desaturase (delta-9 desaturase)
MTTELRARPRTRKSSRRGAAAKSVAERGPSRSQQEMNELLETFYPDKLNWKNIDWVVVAWMVPMHVGALVAPFFFTWSALGVAVLLHWMTASIGICLCYHRYLSHRSLRLAKPAEFFALLCGALSGEGTPLTWTATHRLHHQKSDQPGDPHSPLDGPWWSHILWMCVRRPKEQTELLFRRYVPELMERPLVRFFEKTAFLWLLAMGAGLFALGGLPMLLWAMCVRMVVAYHSTWFVNSATHLWGYRNYDTRDESRNLWWVALLSYGEGWHNNHHAHPSLAPAGHRWWEIDMTWWLIRGLRACGLAYDVRDRIPAANDRQANDLAPAH